MSEPLSAEDAGPARRNHAAPLFVPVRPGGEGCRVRLFRTPLGGRTAVAFTSVRLLAATLGAGQSWVRLAEPALRALAEPLGATALTVDPQLVAPRPAPVDAGDPALPAAPPAGARATAPVRRPAPAAGPLGAPERRSAGRILLVGPGRSV